MRHAQRLAARWRFEDREAAGEMLTNVNWALVNPDGTPCLDENGEQRWRTTTRLWTMSDGIECEIPDRYRQATLEMSRHHFFQNNQHHWHEEQNSKFLWTRDCFIAACEEARSIDWDAEKNRAFDKKQLREQVADFTKAIRVFRKALDKAPFQLGAPQKLTHLFHQMYLHYSDENQEQWLPDLVDNMTSGLTSRNPLAALDGLAEYYDGWRDLGRGYFQYGMIGYEKLPKRLPDKQVALAMILADRFTSCRPDGEQVRQIHLPKAATLSVGTPWEMIRLFVDAAFEEPSNSKNLQRRVQAAIKAGAKIGLRAG